MPCATLALSRTRKKGPPPSVPPPLDAKSIGWPSHDAEQRIHAIRDACMWTKPRVAAYPASRQATWKGSRAIQKVARCRRCPASAARSYRMLCRVSFGRLAGRARP
eukprot:365966-Chlamydomonas_euryale.AAC.2